MIVQVGALRHAHQKIVKIERVCACSFKRSLRALFGRCLPFGTFLCGRLRVNALKAKRQAGPDEAVSHERKESEFTHGLRVYITKNQSGAVRYFIGGLLGVQEGGCTTTGIQPS